MIVPSSGARVLIATRPVDFRKGMDGLAALVQEHLRLDPYSGAIFVFRAKRADRIKLLDLGRQRIGARLQAPGAGPVPLAAGRGRRHAAVAGAALGPH